MLAHDQGGFFGRAAEIELIARGLASDGVLATIVGPPGVGKTRLAIELIASLGPGDHLICDLSELRTGGGVLARIGARLDGLPLALELAASRIATLGAQAVEARLEQQLDALTQPAHERTLRRAIAWSWDLLAPAERAALAQLSVFRGGFDVA